MNQLRQGNVIYQGIGLAVLATVLWSGNFVVARGLFESIPPVSLAFYRWLLATLIIFPFAYKYFRKEWRVVRSSWNYLFWAALTGIALFNTFVYIGARYTSAINLALIGTTSSPIIAVILARIFLKEQIGARKIIGITLCVVGILYLLCQGNFRNLLTLQFTEGDLWVLLAGLSFAIYNTMVRRKPSGISALNFLFVLFALGTLMLLPFFIYETATSPAIHWDVPIVTSILYLGIAASVISFLVWNMAIGKLGAGRTALFGNLIPIFSSLEAFFILNESFTWVHAVSMILVFVGIIIANWGGEYRFSQSRKDSQSQFSQK